MTTYDEQLAELDGKGVDDTLSAVGDDRELARLVLEREQAKGADARSTLVGPLEKLLAGPEVLQAPDAGEPAEDTAEEPEHIGPEVFTIRES